MLRGIKILITLTLLAFLKSSISYSQTIVLDSNNDTCLQFKISKAKYLLKQAYKAKEYQKLDSLCETQSVLKDSVIKHGKTTEVILTNKVKITQEIADTYKYENGKMHEEVKKEQNATKRQRIYKTASIVLNIALCAAIVYASIQLK